MQLKDLGATDAALLSRLLDDALDVPAARRPEWLAGMAREHGALVALLESLLRAHADADSSHVGALTEVEITGVKPNSLAGRVVAHPS